MPKQNPQNVPPTTQRPLLHHRSKTPLQTMPRPKTMPRIRTPISPIRPTRGMGRTHPPPVSGRS
jgi:hypothetical protein